MTGEAQAQIQKFIFNVSMGNYAKANEQLKKVINVKINDRYKEQLEQVKNKGGKH